MLNNCAPSLLLLNILNRQSPQIWDLESKSVVDDLRPEFSKTFGKKATIPYCVSLAWSADGSTLYAGYTGEWAATTAYAMKLGGRLSRNVGAATQCQSDGSDADGMHVDNCLSSWHWPTPSPAAPPLPPLPLPQTARSASLWSLTACKPGASQGRFFSRRDAPKAHPLGASGSAPAPPSAACARACSLPRLLCLRCVNKLAAILP